MLTHCPPDRVRAPTPADRPYIPIVRPALGAPATGPETIATSRARAARRISADAARTASCIVNSGAPRCIGSARRSDTSASVRATTMAELRTRPRVRPT